MNPNWGFTQYRYKQTKLCEIYARGNENTTLQTTFHALQRVNEFTVQPEGNFSGEMANISLSHYLTQVCVKSIDVWCGRTSQLVDKYTSVQVMLNFIQKSQICASNGHLFVSDIKAWAWIIAKQHTIYKSSF